MKKFRITFDHTVVATRSCVIEAESLEEAKEIAYDEDFSPYDGDDDIEEEAEQGLTIEITDVSLLEN